VGLVRVGEGKKGREGKGKGKGGGRSREEDEGGRRVRGDEKGSAAFTLLRRWPLGDPTDVLKRRLGYLSSQQGFAEAHLCSRTRTHLRKGRYCLYLLKEKRPPKRCQKNCRE